MTRRKAGNQWRKHVGGGIIVLACTRSAQRTLRTSSSGFMGNCGTAGRGHLRKNWRMGKSRSIPKIFDGCRRCKTASGMQQQAAVALPARNEGMAPAQAEDLSAVHALP